MRFGLQEFTIEQIHSILSQFPEVEQVILYGSRAKGTHHASSDIDLTFIGQLFNLTTLNKISWQLDDLLLPYTFDLSIYDQIKQPDLLDHIERVGIIFYKKSK